MDDQKIQNHIKNKKSYKREMNRKMRLKKKDKIKWIQEIRIAFLTSILFMIFTTFLFWMAHMMSPGEFKGEKLELYLKKELADMLNITFQNSEMLFEKQSEMNVSVTDEDEIKLICGSYGEKGDISLSGRFISIWTRREKGFLNEFFGTEPRYEIAFLKNSNEMFHSWELMCEDVTYEDFDENNLNDFKIVYNTIFGDRSSKAVIYLLQDIDGWEFVVPDLSEVKEEIEQSTQIHRTAMLDVFKFYDVDIEMEPETVYSLSMYGTIYSVENPLWGDMDYLYYIAVNNDTSIMETDHCALVMMRFTDDYKLVRDVNWNGGEIYIGPCDTLDLGNFVSEHWGMQAEDGMIFYGEDIK